MDGFVNILKPTGMTSHDVVAQIRRMVPKTKVGHTGTLDPNAAGVLPICIGRATKFSDYLLKRKKRYYAQIRFGKQTDTLDSYGKIVEEKNIFPYTREDIECTIQKFTGNILQIPPKYSAIKINGQKLYQAARRGEDIAEIKPREVTIYSIKLCSFHQETIELDVTCSSGTYIRTLAEDIGRELNNLAYLSLLIRLESGEFMIENSITLEEIRTLCEENRLEEGVRSIDEVLSFYPCIVVLEDKLKIYQNGGTVILSEKMKQSGIFRVYTHHNVFLGLGFVEYKEERQYLKNIKFA